MQLKIGVMGNASPNLPEKIKQRAFDLGCSIADNDCVTITGGCPGYPYEAAKGAKSRGGLVIGISPGLSLWEHQHKYQSPIEHHDVLIFTGSGLMGREVVNIRSSDVVVIVGGKSGTLGEFSIAYDEGKLIGVLTGTGGITSEISHLVKVIRKDTGAKVLYEDNPRKLIPRLLRYYHRVHYKHPTCFRDTTIPVQA